MGSEMVVQVLREALMAAFWMAVPLLVIGFAVTVVINIIQIATSLQDPSVSAFPRLIAFLAGSVLLLPWMLNKAASYTLAVFTGLANCGR